MNISIFGLGYVGCVSLGCLAKKGNNVIGVDIQKLKVELINKGKPTIIEKDIDNIIAEQHKLGRIIAISDHFEAVFESEISFICVGTPSNESGHLNLDHIYQTAAQIGEALKNKKEFHIIIIRSTVLPGTNKKVGEIIEQITGKTRNKDFAVVSNPEFLREGTAVNDYFNPPLTVLGSDNEYALDLIEKLYEGINGPIERVQIEVAELIKYVNNSFHALKITFANEVGNICKNLKIDSHEVMRIFGLDKQLNISTYYLKPGFAYGGSCLPKDLRALNTLVHDFYLESPVLNSVERSNQFQKDVAFRMIEKKNKRKIGILGLSFKPGTDDLRYSPIVEIIERLIGKGYQVKIYDKNVNLSKLIGKNKSYIEEKLPHISELLTDDINNVIAFSELVVIANKESEFNYLKIKEEKIIVDFVRIEAFEKHPNYNGICW